ncbi:MAG TPA: DUF1800 family protein [Methylosinus sp.]|jgi:uncharacterized protein (DUF1800 family)|uniref:DUF1800 domain-containing protein n=1 Tax=Methylosinus sp. TaxID=427 RepID=UPI002F91D21E
MAVDPDPRGALIALNRFGLGAKPGDLAAAAADPRGFLLEELRRTGVARLDAASLALSNVALQALFADQQEKRMERERVMAVETTRVSMVGPAAAMAAPAAPPPGVDGKPKPQEPPVEQKLFRAEAMARFDKQASAQAGFVERLVAFWSNHFAVSVAKGQFVRVAAGPFEREAIRPHALGRFADMLAAVESHPAMLFYLDNQRSIGPGSAAGRFAGKGLNENLAREILELHTLGVGGGYSQADVTALARIITGWSFAEAESEAGEPGGFVFKANWHEPGAPTLLGKSYPQTGRDQGAAALADIARHPATATHLATKLARHFIADAPPKPIVEALAKTFRETDGDLAAVAETLIESDLAWSAPFSKIRTPDEFLVAAARATGALPNDPGQYLNMLNAMGMPLWQPPGPNGYPDRLDALASPEAMKLRLDVAWQIAQRSKDIGHPLSVLDTAAGLAASRETREAVSRAESRPQALAILLMSPEFQRR